MLLAVAIVLAGLLLAPAGAAAKKKKKTLKVVPGITYAMDSPAAPPSRSFSVTVSGTVKPYSPSGGSVSGPAGAGCLARWIVNTQISARPGMNGDQLVSSLALLPLDAAGVFSTTLDVSFTSDKTSPNYAPSYEIIAQMRIPTAVKFKLNGRKILCTQYGASDVPGNFDGFHPVDPPDPP